MICNCGHNKQSHEHLGGIDPTWSPCNVILAVEGPITYYCLCAHFKANNLKYLEQKYEGSLK
jgi:hypothetical protein